MNIYQKYASRKIDERHHFNTDLSSSPIKLRPLSGQFDIFGGQESVTKQISDWQGIFPNAAFFAGKDDFFGPVVTMVFKNEATSKLCTMSITKFGCNVFENLILDASSRFWPACDNLIPEHRDSNVRKALAITNLKNYNKLWKNKGQVPVTLEWDETNAGSLASKMEVLAGRIPEQLGSQLLTLGLLQDHTLSSTVVDVVYNNRNPPGGNKTVEENNKIVTLLGEQLNRLFDPLLEYSPQTLEYEYEPPSNPNVPFLHSNTTVKAILKELLDVQTHYTMDLVCVLQDFIIPLRVHVLNSSSTSTLGISKVNQVFPPTIDEITRINCIAHDALTKAQTYGYVEVFKVFSTMLPFFYNAFVRHQANLSKFHLHYSKFVHYNRECIFDSNEVNKGGYTARKLETIISGTIFELPRIKLIIHRLYKTIMEETERAMNFEKIEESEGDTLTLYYNTIMEIIDSFGYNETAIDMSKQRVFTPSGKLLTELATGWPTELQYGWMDRKVVGIFQLTNVFNKYTEKAGDEVLIIFSDHLLFIEIEEQSTKKFVLLLPEILMNSLINAKPLPKFSHFPQLKVKYWCDIDNLVVRSYEAESTQYLNFTTYGKNHFRDKGDVKILSVQNYEMSSKKDSFSTCQNIMELISKAQVLSKSVPFHLFKSNDKQLRTYFCAHDKTDYESENSRSPVIILLNMNKEDVKNVFATSKSVFFIYNIVLLNDHTLQLNGFSRHKIDDCEVDEIVSVEEFSETLKELLYYSLEAMFRSSFLSPEMMAANLLFIEFFTEGPEESAVIAQKTMNSAQPAFEDKRAKKESQFGQEFDMDVYPETSVVPKTNSIKVEEKEIDQGIVEPESFNKKDSKNVAGNRKSLILAIFDKLKKKYKDEDIKAKEDFKKNHSAQKPIPETGICRGRKLVYKNLFSPEPRLRESSIVSEITTCSPKNTEKDQSTQPPLETSNHGVHVSMAHETLAQSRVVSTHTATSSRYTDGSLDVNSHFVFPHEGEPVNKEQTQSEVKQNTRRKSDVPKLFPEPRRTNGSKTGLRVASDAETECHNDNGRQKFIEAVPGLDVVSVPKMKTLDSLTTIKLSTKPVEIEQLSWQPASRELKISENTEAVAKTSSRQLFSSHDIANALENINASGISPDVYAKYKQYEEVPVSTFYNDGEQNWCHYTRENSSNLQEEINAMKDEANMDTLDVIDIGTQISMVPAQQFDSSDATFSSKECATFTQGDLGQNTSDNSVVKTNISDYTRKVKKKESVRSLNSVDFINDFSKRLELQFHLDNNGGIVLEPRFSSDISESYQRSRDVFLYISQTTIDSNTKAKRPTAPVSVGHEDIISRGEPISQEKRNSDASLMPLGSPNISSSEDEYFSSNDFNTALEHYKVNCLDGEDYATSTSSSSDRTLMNELLSSPKDTKEEALGLKLDSVAYLSDILNGTVQF